jgi:hypothetical protein
VLPEFFTTLIFTLDTLDTVLTVLYIAVSTLVRRTSTDFICIDQGLYIFISDAAVSDRGMLDIGPSITPRNISASHVLTLSDGSTPRHLMRRFRMFPCSQCSITAK